MQTAISTVSEEIGEGKYKRDLESLGSHSRWNDEIDTLSDTIKIMISKVAEREKKLRKRVSQLEIIVDSTQRDLEVKKITESDFFQELKAKSKDMRKRFKEGGDE